MWKDLAEYFSLSSRIIRAGKLLLVSFLNEASRVISNPNMGSQSKANLFWDIHTIVHVVM